MSSKNNPDTNQHGICASTRGFGWLQIVIVLAIMLIVAYAVFNVFLPQITMTAKVLNITFDSPEERLQAEFTPATLQTHKGLVQGFLERAKDDIEIGITFTGEIHRSGFIGEDCLLCADYTFEARQRIPFREFTRGVKTYRVTAKDIISGTGGADEKGVGEEDIGTIDAAGVEMLVGVVPKNNMRGSGRGSGETWNVWLHMADENGQPMIDAERRKPLMLLLGTISDVQAQGREITYHISPAYEYENEDDETEDSDDGQANDQEVTI